MSAAQWRRAMNAPIGAAGSHASVPRPAMEMPKPAPIVVTADAPRWLQLLRTRVSPRHVIVTLAVLLYPFVATPFFTFQIGAQALGLGLIALSLTFLGGYGGMVSLAQATVAGMAGYMVAIFGSSTMTTISLGWPWWLAVAIAVVIATVFATLVGWLSVRTEGIYTIMI